jgi:hypothetical protein
LKKTNNIFFLIIATYLLSCTGQITSQNSNIPKTTTQLGNEVSKLDNTIWDIYQDRNSNFWFGSKENGLFIFDGSTLRHLTKDDGLVSNQVRGFQEDSFGNVFIETMEGVSKYDGKSFKTLEILGENSTENIWKLNPSDLWFRIGSDKKGPYRYDGEFLRYLKFPKSPQEDKFYSKESRGNYSPYGIYTIYKDRKGVIWFGTASLGLCRFDGEKISWHYEEQLQTTPNGGDFGMRAIFEDSDARFWFNNTRYSYKILQNHTSLIEHRKEKGLAYIDRNKEQEFPFFLSIEQDNKGDLWMVTYSNGVWRNNGKELINYPIKDGEIDVLLFKIFKDYKGILWLGTHNAGVYKYNGKSFIKFEK